MSQLVEVELPNDAIGAILNGRFYDTTFSQVDLAQMFLDAGWLEIHLACQASLALCDGNHQVAAHYLTKLRSLPESRVQAMVITKLNTIIDRIHEAKKVEPEPERKVFKRRR